MRSHAKHPGGHLTLWKLAHRHRVFLPGDAHSDSAGRHPAPQPDLRLHRAGHGPLVTARARRRRPHAALAGGSRARSTCRQARARRPARPPASGRPGAAASGAYSTLHFAEGADAQRVAQHVVPDLHPPVVFLLLSHLRRAQPRSAAGSSGRVPPPPPPRAPQGGRRLPTVQRARGGGGGGGKAGVAEGRGAGSGGVGAPGRERRRRRRLQPGAGRGAGGGGAGLGAARCAGEGPAREWTAPPPVRELLARERTSEPAVGETEGAKA